MKKRLAAAIAAIAFLVGCAGGAPKAGVAHKMELAVTPPSPSALKPMTVVQVTARIEPKVEMDWVSGTVKILRAPVIPFKFNPATGLWGFKMQVPPMTVVPKGSYVIKAWGRTRAGEELSSSLNYQVP